MVTYLGQMAVMLMVWAELRDRVWLAEEPNLCPFEDLGELHRRV